jgi:hypothetical protein
LFEREGHAGIIRNLLLRSWCSQKAAGQSTGQVAAAPQSVDSDEMMSPGRAGE